MGGSILASVLEVKADALDDFHGDAPLGIDVKSPMQRRVVYGVSALVNCLDEGNEARFELIKERGHVPGSHPGFKGVEKHIVGIVFKSEGVGLLDLQFQDAGKMWLKGAKVALFPLVPTRLGRARSLFPTPRPVW